jgi:HlyD family secretion protein
MMRRLVPFLIGVLVLAAFAWTLVFLYRKSQAAPVHFKTGAPEIADIVRKTVATGSIVPRQEIEIKPRVSGVIEELFVEAGQVVEAGQPIARIKIIPNVVTLNSAESQVETARISFENAKKELGRFKDLAAANLISDIEYSRLALEHELKQKDLEAARANLQLIKSGAAKGAGKVSNVVASTVKGMVIDVPVKQGASVTETNNFNPGTTIAFVADMGDMIFQGRVDESEVGKIKEGMPLDIKIGAVDRKTFGGKLEYIAPKGQLVDGAIQFEIRASIQPVEGTFIRANYSANADIVLARREKVLALDESMLQFDKDGTPFVELEVAPQKFERRAVKLGLSDGQKVEILEGIAEGDKLKRPDSGKPAGAEKAGPARRRR